MIAMAASGRIPAAPAVGLPGPLPVSDLPVWPPYRDGALGLVLSAVVLWNTRYTDAALAAMRATGHLVNDADIARLSPRADRHINMLGRYAFTTPTGPGLRPLRDPSHPEDE